jgi:hypothetical protein
MAIKESILGELNYNSPTSTTFHPVDDFSGFGLDQNSTNLFAGKHMPSNLYFCGWQSGTNNRIVFKMSGFDSYVKNVEKMVGNTKFFWHNHRMNSLDINLQEWMICTYDGRDLNNLSTLGCLLQAKDLNLNIENDFFAMGPTSAPMWYTFSNPSIDIKFGIGTDHLGSIALLIR